MTVLWLSQLQSLLPSVSCLTSPLLLPASRTHLLNKPLALESLCQDWFGGRIQPETPPKHSFPLFPPDLFPWEYPPRYVAMP